MPPQLNTQDQRRQFIPQGDVPVTIGRHPASNYLEFSPDPAQK